MNSSPQHTPGPWSIFDHGDETRINVRGPDEQFVADCADGFYSDDDGGWIMAVESLPNARLIAAAPEMLAALEHAARSEHHPHCESRGRSIRCSCHVGKARAAITKARGQ